MINLYTTKVIQKITHIGYELKYSNMIIILTNNGSLRMYHRELFEKEN